MLEWIRKHSGNESQAGLLTTLTAQMLIYHSVGLSACLPTYLLVCLFVCLPAYSASWETFQTAFSSSFVFVVGAFIRFLMIMSCLKERDGVHEMLFPPIVVEKQLECSGAQTALAWGVRTPDTTSDQQQLWEGRRASWTDSQ